MADTFPRQYARTRRLTLGEPRTFTVSDDGLRVAFCRSTAGDDPVNALWLADLAAGAEHLVADPRELLAGLADAGLAGGSGAEADLPDEERRRRERAREGAGGVVAYATDPGVRVAAFALAGRLFVAGLLSARGRELVVPGPVFDPRPDPGATRVAYVADGALHLAELDGTSRLLVGDPDPDVTWGVAEFIAAEEMGRSRGYWWAPDGTRLAVARVDNRPVERWYLSDPADPAAEPTPVRYPRAGTANADVTLHVVGLDGSAVEVVWDRDRLPYLVDVHWPAGGPLTLATQSRDQRRLAVLRADPDSGATAEVATDADPAWVEVVAGVPRWLDGGRLVTCADREGARRLLVDGTPVTPASLQVRNVCHVGADDVVFCANDLDEPLEVHVWRWRANGPTDSGTAGADDDPAPGRCERLTDAPGVHQAWAGGATVVVRRSGPDDERPVVTVHTDAPGAAGTTIASHAEAPLVSPSPTFLRLGQRALATALLLPAGADPGARLPVVLDPYGGPHAQRVVRSRTAHAASQWLADQGFAVVVVDGRGTPGRGSDWERAVHLDLAGPVLEDQVDALHALAEVEPRLDLGRVGIRGWSFGGYLAALAVLRRPDVFHAAVAGAPVTEWRLYDTHYTERYLGDPTDDPGPYDHTSLLAEAGRLERPLLLVHGLVDDNVVAAHTLQLSSALVAHGRPHAVLPLAGVTHMTPQEVVAENLLALQVAFLRDALGAR